MTKHELDMRGNAIVLEHEEESNLAKMRKEREPENSKNDDKKESSKQC